MNLTKIASVKNLELAWRRINTGRNLQYKQFYRPLYLAYEAGLEQNLKDLSKHLKGSWHASEAARTYMPKPSGLQRPITLLKLEDQIVYQAIANVISAKMHKKRKAVELKTVFSNILCTDNDSIFFINRWQDTYSQFHKTCEAHFKDGYQWIAHFDLAAYYDTICHERLVKIIAPRADGSDESLKRLKTWLNKWTHSDRILSTQHGIPQGPLASDFFAEIFMLPIDAEMSKLPIKYVRYVDDIRIFAKDSLAAQSAAIKLEQCCRESGLIPQGGKFSIKKATRLKEVLGQLPSISADSADGELEVVTAEKMFRESLEGKPLRCVDKSRFRYVLYRAPASSKILKWCIQLLPLHPEHIDAFVVYFGNFTKSKPLERAICQMLQDGVPHDYVRGQLWHILARIANNDTLTTMERTARAEYKSKRNCPVHAWGTLHFLLKCEGAGLGKHMFLVPGSHWVPKSLLPPVFPDRAFRPDGPASKILLSKVFEEGIAIAREIRNRNLGLQDMRLKGNQLDGRVQTVLKGLGIIQRRRNHAVDQVGQLLNKRYGIRVEGVWRKLLGSEYEHALQLLIEADQCYGPDRSHWLQFQNSFNDAVCRALIPFLQTVNKLGACKTIASSGKLVTFGILVASKTPLDKAYPLIASAFRDTNNRRNKLPGSHPYDEKGGSKNKWLKQQEQWTLSSQLKDAYQAIYTAVNT